MGKGLSQDRLRNPRKGSQKAQDPQRARRLQNPQKRRKEPPRRKRL